MGRWVVRKDGQLAGTVRDEMASDALWLMRDMNQDESTGPLTRTAHSFACSTLVSLLVCSVVLICSLTCSLTRFQAHGKEVFVHEINASISYSFNPLCTDDKMICGVDFLLFPHCTMVHINQESRC